MRGGGAQERLQEGGAGKVGEVQKGMSRVPPPPTGPGMGFPTKSPREQVPQWGTNPGLCPLEGSASWKILP